MSFIVDIKKRLDNFYLDVSLEPGGGILGLLGASGSGKSLTLMCIAGIVKPDSGKIILNGRTLFDSEKKINIPPQKRHVGYLFQNYALFPNMTVRQNILCGLHNERSKGKKESLLKDMICLVQLEGYENHYPAEISGGQAQRAALARILAGNPDMLVLDEPFSALDTHLRGQLMVETNKLLKSFGKDTLLVTHNRNEAYELCNHIALLDSGKLIIKKETKSFFSDPESCQAALLTGCKNVINAKKIGDYLVDVPAWGVQFTTTQPVMDGLCSIGIRAHYFNPRATQNCFPIQVTGEIESPFEYNIQFRYAGQNKESQDIWWRIAKEKRSGEFPSILGVSPHNIMLLYK